MFGMLVKKLRRRKKARSFFSILRSYALWCSVLCLRSGLAFHPQEELHQYRTVSYRVAKCDVTKIKICELMGFIEIIRAKTRLNMYPC